LSGENITLETATERAGTGEALKFKVTICGERTQAETAPVKPAGLLTITLVVCIGRAREGRGISPTLYMLASDLMDSMSLHTADASWRPEAKATIVERVDLMMNIEMQRQDTFQRKFCENIKLIVRYLRQRLYVRTNEKKQEKNEIKGSEWLWISKGQDANIDGRRDLGGMERQEKVTTRGISGCIISLEAVGSRGSRPSQPPLLDLLSATHVS
jgi:hypothetical protein